MAVGPGKAVECTLTGVAFEGPQDLGRRYTLRCKEGNGLAALLALGPGLDFFKLRVTERANTVEFGQELVSRVVGLHQEEGARFKMEGHAMRAPVEREVALEASFRTSEQNSGQRDLSQPSRFREIARIGHGKRRRHCGFRGTVQRG